MKVFKLVIDEKTTIWHRTIVDIDAKSLKDAVEKAKNNNYDKSEADTQWLYDTCELIEPENNKNKEATIEIFSDLTKNPQYTNK